MWSFQLETIQRLIEKLELFTNHQYIKAMMLYTDYTPYILFCSISLDHVQYLIWLSPIQIRKEIWAHFQENHLRCWILGTLPP
jgi:hypothetical protein